MFENVTPSSATCKSFSESFEKFSGFTYKSHCGRRINRFGKIYHFCILPGLNVHDIRPSKKSKTKFSIGGMSKNVIVKISSVSH